jgi:hypothetical protein
MGGKGSGRWEGHQKATTVEACQVLNLASLAREGAFVGGARGTLEWPGGCPISYAEFAVSATEGGLLLVLRYRLVRPSVDVLQPVPLETTRPRFGGVRWWGRCHLVADGAPHPLVGPGVACGRRVGKLYLPPGRVYFGCRRCYRLTYRSAQEREPKLERLLRDLEARRALMEIDPATLPPGRWLRHVLLLMRLGSKLMEGKGVPD